jgi:hypothetical protein
MIVFPRPRVHSTPAQANDDGQVLNADRALVFARAAGGALEICSDGVVLADNAFGRRGAKLIQIAAHAKNDFLRI